MLTFPSNMPRFLDADIGKCSSFIKYSVKCCIVLLNLVVSNEARRFDIVVDQVNITHIMEV